MNEVPFRKQLLLMLVDKLLIALILVAAGLWAQQHLELFKNKQAKHAETVAAQVAVIQRQLAEFYYPIFFRLEKDNAVWQHIMDREKDLAEKVESGFIMPNHDEILKILDSHADLMFNPSEPINERLIDAVKQYERHMAVYKALRQAHDERRPADLKENWPEDFYPAIKARILELEMQRSDLLRNGE